MTLLRRLDGCVLTRVFIGCLTCNIFGIKIRLLTCSISSLGVRLLRNFRRLVRGRLRTYLVFLILDFNDRNSLGIIYGKRRYFGYLYNHLKVGRGLFLDNTLTRIIVLYRRARILVLYVNGL